MADGKGETAIHNAGKENHGGIFTLLLEAGADPTVDAMRLCGCADALRCEIWAD